MQNKNLKLGLCGLALTSFLALNAHSVVHADTVQNNNANAITWDSDSDDSQVIKEAPEQEKVSQSVQKQVPVQSHVQVSYSQPVQNKKIMVSDISSTSALQKRAEMSNLRQSNAQTSTVNRLNADNHQVKVANVNATDPIKITNPQNNQIVVHYTNTKGQAVSGLADKTIDLSSTGNGNYVPSGYSLAHGSGQYSVNVTSREMIPDFDVYWNTETNKLHMDKNQSYGSSDFELKWDSDGHHVKWDTDGHHAPSGAIDGELLTDNDAKRLALNLVRNVAKATNNGYLLTGDNTEGWAIDGGSLHPMNYFRIEFDPCREDPNRLEGGTPFDRFYIEFESDNWDFEPGAWIVDSRYRAEAGHRHDPDFDSNKNDFQMAEKLKTWWLNKRTQSGIANPHEDAYYTPIHDSGGEGYPTYSLFVGGSNGKQFANGDTVFTDGGSATSSVGNHINVPVVQAVSVNAGSDIRKVATRIISVNLPDDPAVKERYKDILNANNQIVQTLSFTRTMTKDGLTGEVLTQTPWTGPSSFPSVTLPDIPGYTMTMS